MEFETYDVAGSTARVAREGNGLPLVYLHGSGGANWTPGLKLLAERFRVYLPEHPGFGESERPDWIETVQDVALFYLDLFEEMGLTQINLVGQSLGGWIAAELASLCSHSLRRLVLVDAAGLQLSEIAQADMFTMTPETWTKTLYHDQALAERILAVEPTPEVLRKQVRNLAMTARLSWNPYMSDPRLQPRLRRIRVPALMVWGAEDRVFPPAYAQAYSNAIPDSRVAIIDQCGHVPAAEQSQEFARLVTEFLVS